MLWHIRAILKTYFMITSFITNSNQTASAAVSLTASLPPAVVRLFAPNAPAARCFMNFFTAQIRSDHTRRAYWNAVRRFSLWCETHGLGQLCQVEPFHVAAFLQHLQGTLAPASVKQHLAALRMLFDWMVIERVIAMNPAQAVRGPRHSVKAGKTPILTSEEARCLLESIDTSTVIGLRDRALIGLMIYTFARVGAALRMKVEDVYIQGRRYWVRLHEKGGKTHTLPCHHKLEDYLLDYLEGARLGADPKAPLFPSVGPGGLLSSRPMDQSAVYYMIQRRAKAAGIATKIGCHSFRATGITEYLRNGGRLEVAQQMANHESPRTTRLYDRRGDQVSLEEVERIAI